MPTPNEETDPEGPSALHLQNLLTEAELADKLDGFYHHASDDCPPEVEAAFLARVKAMELGGPDDYVTIRSVLAGSGYEPYKRVKRRGNWAEAVARFLDCCQSRGLMTVQPERMSDEDFYHFLTHDFLEHRVPPPTPPLPGAETAHLIGVMYEQVRQDSPEDMAAVTEDFLLDLLDLLDPAQPFTGESLARECRWGTEVVSRDEARAGIQAWKERWTEIVPVGFHPEEPMFGPDGTLYLQFGCAYTVTDRAGETTAYESPGVMQLTLEGKAWRVVGCAMDGFEM